MTFATEVTAIWGCRGSGKTTLARGLIAKNKIKRAVIIDPMADDGCRSVGEVLTALDAGQARVVLCSSDRPEILRTVYGAYLRSTSRTPLYLVCDEAPAYFDRTTDALNKIMFQGRHRAFGMLIIGQRPTAVDANIRSQAASTFWMRLTDHRDLQVASQAIGPERARRLADLKEGAFLKHPER
jgi:DNA helicase HerA-like ATPase